MPHAKKQTKKRFTKQSFIPPAVTILYGEPTWKSSVWNVHFYVCFYPFKFLCRFFLSVQCQERQSKFSILCKPNGQLISLMLILFQPSKPTQLHFINTYHDSISGAKEEKLIHVKTSKSEKNVSVLHFTQSS